MDRSTTASTFKALVAEKLGVDESKILDTSTFVSLGADSLDQNELWLAAEETFNFDASDESVYSDLDTVGQAIEFISTKTSK
ncbi:acyl carrier protein [Pseudomonas lutea]|jgi:acyl carrier protein|uniref:Acyl carrier protein n=1 Tax=Pseudomonas lutea TaxID=243924 RepID=A0A9X0EIP4_9PSED|nr:acyl carrier protein [Pseudomonas lutea]KGF66564.1 hypothetical protein LT42_11970 [Pseudomonas lutea]